jgi:phage shock protein PspC (stress-responsive transcriptional regulator)
MQKVITINLNGNAYQLDESGYDALRAYLDNGEARLESNPDKAEILADLEQAIAEKCVRCVGPGKTVVSGPEVDQILRETGPVDSGDSPGSSQGAAPHSRETTAHAAPPKRLYQIREGAMISGVCNGLAAYFNLDPTIVRIAFVLSTLLTLSGPGWLVPVIYIVLAFVVPYAKTSEQLAAAQGSSEGLPYRAQELVEKVKAKLAGKSWPWSKRAS